MHIVEVCRPSAALTAAMAQMRTWLDHHRVEPAVFEVAFLPGAQIRFRVQFKEARDALVFARVFEGIVVGANSVAA